VSWRRAVLTGASHGLGRALAFELALRGVDLLLVARGAPALDETAAEVRALGVTVVTASLDVSDTTRLVDLLREEDAKAPIDLVVANAAVGRTHGFREHAWESFEAALRVNLLGAAATLAALTDVMIARGSGHLLAMSSLSSLTALPGSAAYCVPKAGLNMLVDVLRLDLAPHGVAVTNALLGFVKTRMVERSTHPMPQLMSAEDAARAIVSRAATRPREIVLPRALAMTVAALSKLPPSIRDRLFSETARRFGAGTR
jgi:short-subunit dehydrogenase